MNVWVYTICRNEAVMMPFFLRHYETFATKIIAYDEQSTDGTREMLKAHPLVEVREWPHKGLDDEHFLNAVNTFWIGADCDWVIWADVDELLYHPNPFFELACNDASAIRSIGYALISANGFDPKAVGQIYDQVKTGIRQPNYDKIICWRPQVKMVHTIGRHTYQGQFPKCSGLISDIPGFYLLHCHHVGGVEWTRQINQRNYDRAVNKKYAWNYSPGHNDDPNQVGSVAWVQSAIQNGKLEQVIP